jgi:hypothetical protein
MSEAIAKKLKSGEEPRSVLTYASSAVEKMLERVGECVGEVRRDRT